MLLNTQNEGTKNIVIHNNILSPLPNSYHIDKYSKYTCETNDTDSIVSEVCGIVPYSNGNKYNEYFISCDIFLKL